MEINVNEFKIHGSYFDCNYGQFVQFRHVLSQLECLKNSVHKAHSRNCKLNLKKKIERRFESSQKVFDDFKHLFRKTNSLKSDKNG